MIGEEEEALLRREGPRNVFPTVAVALLPVTCVLGVVSLGLGSWLAEKDVRYFNYTGNQNHPWDEMGWKEGVWAGALVSLWRRVCSRDGNRRSCHFFAKPQIEVLVYYRIAHDVLH